MAFSGYQVTSLTQCEYVVNILVQNDTHPVLNLCVHPCTIIYGLSTSFLLLMLLMREKITSSLPPAQFAWAPHKH